MANQFWGGGGAATAVGTVGSGQIVDGTIVNADINASAAIAASKLDGTLAPLASPTFTGTPVLPTGTTATTQSGHDNSTKLATTAYLDGLFTTKGDLIAASAANTPARVAIGSNGDLVGASNGVIAGVKRSENLRTRTGALAQTFPRTVSNMTNVAAFTTSVTHMQLIELYAGQVIGHITFLSGTTAGSAMTHQWFFLTDSSRVQVATTADDTSTAWGASAEKTLAIATIASGASSTYTVPSDGAYYLGFCVTGTTVPTLIGASGGASTTTLNTLPPIHCGTSDTISSGPPAFAKTYGALTADPKEPWAYVSA